MSRRKVDPTWFDEEVEEQQNEVRELSVPPEHEGSRLDLFLVAHFPERSRSLLQDWIESGQVLVGMRPGKASSRLKAGQEVLVEIPALEPAEPEAEQIPLDVLFEDEHLLVLNKARGMVVHPAVGNFQGTLVNALLWHCRDLSGIRGVEKPGIVHRLDKDTSGLMVVAKNDQAHLGLTNQFAERMVNKHYQAIVHGHPQPARGRVDQPIGRHPVDRIRMAVNPRGKTAITDYEVNQQLGSYSLLDLQIHTGRTHQIRVHLTWLGFPIVGDPLYGRRSHPFAIQGQALHCARLGFRHPAEHRPMEFAVGPPADMQAILGALR
ncbi:MAG: RluA family pseudouridine synthase [Vulcanimicrobiota bacterium]